MHAVAAVAVIATALVAGNAPGAGQVAGAAGSPQGAAYAAHGAVLPVSQVPVAGQGHTSRAFAAAPAVAPGSAIFSDGFESPESGP